ncbi:MAG: DUF1573 domain-containing protein [Opitutaceae bacterium]|jgi:hypothetical protein|nr:DUF1573 domain-containing protein [Opitutaceae bacterium]
MKRSATLLAPLLFLSGLIATIGAPHALPPATTRAALLFDHTTAKLEAAETDTEAVAIFPFKNTGKTTVTLTAIESGCGCTVGEVTRRTWKPGESGDIRVTFTFGVRVGQQSSHLTVKTDDGAPATELSVEVDIPELLVAEPATLAFARTARPGQQLTTTVMPVGSLALKSLTAGSGEGSIRPSVTRVANVKDAAAPWTLTVARPEKPGTWPVALSATFDGGVTRRITVWVILPE